MSIIDQFPDKLTDKEVAEIYPHKRQFRTMDGDLWEIIYDRTPMITRKYFCEMKIGGKTYLVDRDSLMMMLADDHCTTPPKPIELVTGEDGHLHLKK